MPETMVNQLMSCYWIEMGLTIELTEKAGKAEEDVMETVKKIRNRPKPKFQF